MSIFNWSAVLPEAVEQAGYRCIYVSRMWDESAVEEQRRREAHSAIVEGLERGAPAVVWDIAGCEWGLIIGYDQERSLYDTLTDEGKPSTLAFDKLGRNGIDILSVAIPGEPTGRSREEVVLDSLKAAVAHAEGEEWTERPAYENGLAGYEMWATAYDRWALILEAGSARKIGKDVQGHARYYAGHHLSARCYARDYLRGLADDEALRNASSCYERVASCLKPVWEYHSGVKRPEGASLRSLAESIRGAKAAEEEALGQIQNYLAQTSS